MLLCQLSAFRKGKKKAWPMPPCLVTHSIQSPRTGLSLCIHSGKTRERQVALLCLPLSLFVRVNPTEVAQSSSDRRNRRRQAHPSKPVFRYCPFNCAIHNELKSTNDTNWTGQRGMWDQL